MPRTSPAFAAVWHLVALLAALLLTAAAVGYPRPSAVPQRWQLTFEPGQMRLFIDQGDGRVYWYFTYKVTNRTGVDQTWAPEFTLYTDDGHILVSGHDVPGEIEQDIMTLLGNQFLQQQNEVIGDIRQGPMNAIEGLVVWPAVEMDVTEVSLFIAGISGDTAAVKLPDGSQAILRKTLHREYLVPGNVQAQMHHEIDLIDQKWIFR